MYYLVVEERIAGINAGKTVHKSHKCETEEEALGVLLRWVEAKTSLWKYGSHYYTESRKGRLVYTEGEDVADFGDYMYRVVSEDGPYDEEEEEDEFEDEDEDKDIFADNEEMPIQGEQKEPPVKDWYNFALIANHRKKWYFSDMQEALEIDRLELEVRLCASPVGRVLLEQGDLMNLEKHFELVLKTAIGEAWVRNKDIEEFTNHINLPWRQEDAWKTYIKWAREVGKFDRWRLSLPIMDTEFQF